MLTPSGTPDFTPFGEFMISPIHYIYITECVSIMTTFTGLMTLVYLLGLCDCLVLDLFYWMRYQYLFLRSSSQILVTCVAIECKLYFTLEVDESMMAMMLTPNVFFHLQTRTSKINMPGLGFNKCRIDACIFPYQIYYRS